MEEKQLLVSMEREKTPSEVVETDFIDFDLVRIEEMCG